MAGGAQDDNFFLTSSHGGLLGYTPPPAQFSWPGGRGRCPWRCQRAPLSRTAADGPQAEENTIAADAHRIALVPCDEKEFFVFLAEARKKSLSGCKKKVSPISVPLISTYRIDRGLRTS